VAPKETMSHACEGIQSERAPELAPHARFSFSASTSSIRAQSLLTLLLSLIVPYSNCIHDSRLASCERFQLPPALDNFLHDASSIPTTRCRKERDPNPAHRARCKRQEDPVLHPARSPILELRLHRTVLLLGPKGFHGAHPSRQGKPRRDINLAGALIQLRSRGFLRVWADAICVNQDDMEERGAQVLCMADIYRSASLVKLVVLKYGCAKLSNQSAQLRNSSYHLLLLRNRTSYPTTTSSAPGTSYRPTKTASHTTVKPLAHPFATS